MGVLAYIPAVVTAIAVYSAYGSGKKSTEGGILSIKKYARAYGLGALAMILGFLLGGGALISGDFVSGSIGLLAGIAGVFLVVLIAVFDFGGKAAKEGAEFAKENPEAAAAVATAAGETATELASSSGGSGNSGASSQESQEGSAYSQQVEEMYSNIDTALMRWSMRCPNCGVPWALTNDSKMAHRGVTSCAKNAGVSLDDVAVDISHDGHQMSIGMNILGSDIIGKSDVQCLNCNTQQTVRIE
jgi:hypothetical protein